MIRQALAFIVEDVAFSQEINTLPRGREASACRVPYASDDAPHGRRRWRTRVTAARTSGEQVMCGIHAA